MSGVMEGGMDRSSGSRFGAPGGRLEGGREVRWSARRKREVVLRLLRGESVDGLARETGQAAGVIAGRREGFLAGGHEGLKSRPAPVEDRRLSYAQRKIGELAMDLDTGGPAGARLPRRRSAHRAIELLLRVDSAGATHELLDWAGRAGSGTPSAMT